MTVTDRKNELKSLLPSGQFWSLTSGLNADKLMEAAAIEMDRLHVSAADLLKERIPLQADDLLAEWEAFLGIPDVCQGELSPTIDLRRQDIHAAFTSVGGQTHQYYIDLAINLGYVITIEDGTTMTVEQPCEQPINDERWLYSFSIIANLDEILESGFKRLVCLINKLKPAHTVAIFPAIDLTVEQPCEQPLRFFPV